jgi:Lrp/AsnC family transcriptional regulator for asnA, asnC and gidA
MVRQRLAKLLKRKWLQIAAVADPYEMGYDTPALIGLSFEPKAVEKAVQELMETAEVSYMVMTTGDFDVMIEVMCRDRDHLNQVLSRLKRMPGLTRTQVHLILRSYKMTHVPLEEPPAS